MTTYDAYRRLIEEMHHLKGNRSTHETRANLQDVLSALRDKAAIEEGWSEQETQDEAERAATLAAYSRL